MDTLSSQHAADRLREIEREALRPSPRFLQAVDELARTLELDPDRIAAGEGVQLGGVIFHLAHGGPQDAEAFSLIVHMGEVPAEKPLDVLRRLMEENVAGAAWGLLPGTDIIVQRTRIDLAKPASPAVEVIKHVQAISARFQAMATLAKAAIEAGALFGATAATAQTGGLAK
jgi:hypothetical protein